MADILNLNKARKARAKADAASKAVHNRAKFGRTKAQKAADDAEQARICENLDGARRE